MVTTRIVFETHATTEDNEAGAVSGWRPGRLSTAGREQAEQLGMRRRQDHLDLVFTSDLRRAVETVEIAFAGNSIPVFHDWRLRECDFGTRTSSSVAEIRADRADFIGTPYPGGESWTDAIRRINRFLDDLQHAWSGSRVLVIGHTATRWGFEHLLRGAELADLAVEADEWQPGWEYAAADPRAPERNHGSGALLWRGVFSDAELNDLHADAFDHPVFGDNWNAQLERFSIGWVVARDGTRLIGFLNVISDGGVHAWLQDVIVARSAQRSGVGRDMVSLAVERTRAAGCEWLHVDFDDEHRGFYIDACGFDPTGAGLIEL